jgi:hypothetical protein
VIKSVSQAGLPDGIFSNLKYLHLGKFWRALEWKKVGLFFCHLEYNMAIWYIQWTFIWLFSGDLVYCVKKNLATLF